ncbi:diguanylate cyclase [Campylobacter concisus]|uniref:GGDEF domain-containing response regulator n=1 Tax=Campylobacter concisus TaxID=199 RepID=UPI0018A9204A|nr:diguanylate cyclase [Campylobacter concisus]QPH99079.1 diguanylate cyclase [Campylobacter concisus]QPI00875.1 diguanylate cyclase [Campylobacter concisus]
MERILVVDDNKALAKLIVMQMEKTIDDMTIDVAYSFAEAKTLISEYDKDYFMTILDLNLPDAPNGEIVDYALSKGLSAIVLTGSIDDETRQNFINKDIVDYVYKGNMDDINYIFQMINRLSKNRQYKVLVVEDSLPFRNMIKKILTSLQFKVLAAAHGEEAMNYFADNPDINLIITDYRMPVKDGLEVLKEVRKEKDKNSLGVIVMTSPSEKTDASIFLKNGASDFIAKPFSKEELICRVNNTIEAMENINKIANFANRDFLTGVYNRRFFYSDVEEYVQVAEETNEPYAFAMIDVDYFKKINDKYGHDGGDKILKSIAKILNDNTKGSDIVARFGGEEFCVVLKKINKEEAVKFFVNLRAKVAENEVTIKKEKVKVTISIGVSFGNGHCEIDDMLEACDSALYTAKENGRNRVEIAL